jgi:hypothetical protein
MSGIDERSNKAELRRSQPPSNITVLTVLDSVIADDGWLNEHAVVIRMRARRMIGDIEEIGDRLITCRDRIREKWGHGNWYPWLEKKFGWSVDTADRYMHVAELAKSRNLRDLDMPLSGLYLLAAPTTPETARNEIIQRAEAGQKLSVADVKKTIKSAKRKTGGQPEPVGIGIGDWKTGEGHVESDPVSNHDGGGADEHQHQVSTEPASTPVAPATKTAPPSAKSETELSAIREQVLTEYFESASGSDIYKRIPVEGRNEVIRDFLDQLGVNGMQAAMSSEFGSQLRAKLKPKKPQPIARTAKVGIDKDGKPIFELQSRNSQVHH